MARLMLGGIGLAVLLALPTAGQECPPCAPPESEAVQAVRRDLEEAFRIFLSLPDCSGVANLESCRAMERKLAAAFEALQRVASDSRAEGSASCWSCDPGSHLAPLAASLVSLGKMLVERGYDDFGPTVARMEDESVRFRNARCCDGGGVPVRGERAPSREADARAVLIEKCGSEFVSNRRGLRQVVRAPGEEPGCYQSRACRTASSSEGQVMEAGFWTYDGEYWYIWAERRTPRGDWISCDE